MGSAHVWVQWTQRSTSPNETGLSSVQCEKRGALEQVSQEKHPGRAESDTQGKSTSSRDMQGVPWGSWATASPSGLGGQGKRLQIQCFPNLGSLRCRPTCPGSIYLIWTRFELMHRIWKRVRADCTNTQNSHSVSPPGSNILLHSALTSTSDLSHTLMFTLSLSHTHTLTVSFMAQESNNLLRVSYYWALLWTDGRDHEIRQMIPALSGGKQTSK